MWAIKVTKDELITAENLLKNLIMLNIVFL